MSSEDGLFSGGAFAGRGGKRGWDAIAPEPPVIALFAELSAQRREVGRQQWTFSPGGATEELEEYSVELNGVTAMVLRIDPDRSHDPATSVDYASLINLKLG